MVEGVIESTWDWTVTTDEETNDELNVQMMCLENVSSGSTYFNSVAILAASLTLFASLAI
jgi:hypothetical protein